MLFNSVIFITVFLPIALLGWYVLQRLENPGPAKAFLIGMSLWFYGYYNIGYLWILLASLAFNYVVSGLLDRHKGSRCLLTLGILGNLGLLFYFKYFNFFIDNCNFFLHTDIHLEKIALPLGISFFTFQQLSFVVERYKGGAPHYSVLDYVFFVSFFPQLIAGPIVLHSELIPQLQERKNRRFSASVFYDGLTLFILGLAKKVLLADSLAVLVNAEYANILALDAPSAWIVICWYMAELYFDFSGYCDMARGAAGMFGFRLPENFDSPFRAASVREFWRRWHMTLSRFLTRYIYIPLGGNRKGKARQCVNLLVVFLAVVFETLFPKARFPKEWMNRLATAVFVTLSFSVFRSESLSQAALLWRRLFTGGNTGMFLGICNVLQFPENYAFVKLLGTWAPAALNPFFVFCMILLSGLVILFLSGRTAEQWIVEKGGTPAGTFWLGTLFTWSFLSLSQVSVFLYFNF